MAVLLASDFDAASPYGFDSFDLGNETWYTITIVPGASPSGAAAMRVEWLPTDELGNQRFGGSWVASLPAAPAQGAVRYLRFRYKVEAPVCWQSDSNALEEFEENVRTAPDKLIILGNGSGNNSRVIVHQRASFPDRDDPMIKCTQGDYSADGGAGHIAIATTGEWYSIQIEIQSSSTTIATDGVIKQWINNNNYAAPDTTRTGENILTSGWDSPAELAVGDGSANPLSNVNPAASAIILIADFQFADDFDAGWHVTAVQRRRNRRMRVRG